jgi:hypothetical protein
MGPSCTIELVHESLLRVRVRQACQKPGLVWLVPLVSKIEITQSDIAAAAVDAHDALESSFCPVFEQMIDERLRIQWHN